MLTFSREFGGQVMFKTVISKHQCCLNEEQKIVEIQSGVCVKFITHCRLFFKILSRFSMYVDVCFCALILFLHPIPLHV